MTNLRDIVRRHVEKETLHRFLGTKYPHTPEQEKARILDNLRKISDLDQEVDKILKVFCDDIERHSCRRKRRKYQNITYAGSNLVLTILIAYAVDNVLWPFVWGLAALSLVFHGLFVLWGE